MALAESKTEILTITKELLGSSAISTGSGTLLQDTSYTRNIFVADGGWQVTDFLERHSVLGSTTVMLVGALGSTPIGSGTNLLASTVPLTSAVDVVNVGTLLGSAVLSGSGSFPVLSRGDALGLRWGNAGNLAPVGTVTVVLQRI